MSDEEYILAIKVGGIGFATMEYILHEPEDFKELFPLIEQEYSVKIHEDDN